MIVIKNPMDTKQAWEASYKEIGLLKAINKFTDYVCKASRHIVMAGNTFDHIALGDHNIGDGHIDFCLEQERIMDWFYQQYKDLTNFPKHNCNYHSDNEWESFDWYDLVEGTELVIEFLKWLKTISVEERDNEWCKYYEYG